MRSWMGLLVTTYARKSGPFRCRWSRFISGFLWLLAGSYSYGQSAPASFQLDSVQANGVYLSQGWRFYPGDLPNGAKPQLDDQQWAPVDPTQQLGDLHQLQRAGVGWLRLHLTTGDSLPPVMAYIYQSVASEIYLDGQLLYPFGTISNQPDRVRAYNPCAAYSLPLRPGTSHLLAVRFACQPGLDYSKQYLHWDAAAVEFILFPTTAIPAIRQLTLQAAYSDTIKVGIAFILFMLHLSLFIAYRKQQANLFAATMYLLLCLTFIAKATVDFTHSISTRTLLYYGALIDAWVPAVSLLTFYSLFNLRKGWLFWLAITSIVLRFTHLPGPLDVLYPIVTYYLPLELVRIAIVATRRGQLGAKTVLVGVLVNLGIWLFYSVLTAVGLPFYGNEWIFHSLFLSAFLCIPLTLSLRLALEHGWVNRQLARQNEELEQQVAERTQELRQQANRLNELNQARSRFVTNLTHEFRTPLTLIISPVEKMLESPILPASIQTPLQTVDRNARHLLNQVNQLLDIARLEDGHVSVSLRPVQLGRYTTQLVELFEATAQASQITLTHAVDGDDTSNYLMDTDKWGKIVYNLLANALKFTLPGGRVTVQVTLGPTQVQLVVSDTGIGIAADKLQLIFDRFFQADDNTTRLFEGTGVGLALVRELTNLLSGNVTVDSQSGEGSTFTVCLPATMASPADESSVETPPIPVSVLPTFVPQRDVPEHLVSENLEDARALVLLVEDNDELRAFMTDELAARYRVLTASDGQQGWEQVQQHLPDVVISDVMLPGMDGFQLTNLIKTTPTTDHIAVVLLTARSTHDSQLEGLKQGADDYLVKPFDLVELRLRLANLIARQQKLQNSFRQQLELSVGEAAPEFAQVIDPFLERVYALLEAHLDDTNVGVEWLAQQLAMDRKTLYRKLQSKIQLSPNALIRAYRLRRAGELLRAGKSITETSYSVGFDSVTYFGQCFKDQYQMTPTEFINQLV